MKLFKRKPTWTCGYYEVEMAQTDVTSAMGDLWAYRLVLQTKGDSWWVVSVMYPINQPHDLVRI